MDKNKIFEIDPYKGTADSMKDVVKTLPTYKEVMAAFNGGKNEVELKRRYLLKKLDEAWITVIEDTLPALDTIIRNPQSRLESVEEVLPVEISKHINGRSVIHLTQHTELITDVDKDDNSVIPSKLLNVFSEDTVLTYENKFINTLVNRLYAFVAIRYNGAKDCGEDEKATSIKFTQEFEHNEYKGNIKVEVEIKQKPEEHEVIKNYIYTSDLWKRMVRIYDVVNEYMSSPFIRAMGRNFVRPPVLRTNTIMKNPIFRDCLSLWEFIESYENTGYETLVQEDLLKASDKLIEDMYNSIAEQYIVFQTHILNGFDNEKALDSRLLNVRPLIKDEFDEPNDDEFNYKTLIPGIMKNEGPLEYPEDEIEFAILVALAADAMMWEDEIDDEISVIDEKGDIAYRYKFSIIARLIKAQLPTQDYYNELRNDLLSYKGVKSLLSWSRDLYKLGRKPVAKLNVKGKTLFVYLPLNPKDYDQSHYHHLDVSKEGKEVDYPFLLKVRSNRALKYAKELIASILVGYGVSKDEKYKVRDFHLPEMSLQELLDYDLARPIDKNGPWSFDWTFEDRGFKYTYIYSFIAKLIRSGEERQEFYNEIKNELLSYKPVKSRISWPRELFRAGLTKVAQMKVKGKTLCLYLPMDPDRFDYEHYHHEDVRVEGKENDFGLMLRVKSNRGVKYAKELIAILMAELGLSKYENYVPVDYKFAYKPLEQLLAEDLARIIGQKGHKPEVVAEVPQTEEGFERKYIFSYSARLIRSGDERQDLYNAMKNEVLAYKKVTSKISWSHELFKRGRDKVALFKVRGKTLCVYLPLNPDNYDQEHYHFEDVRVEGKDVEYPLMMKIRSMRAVKYCAELLKDVMAMYGIERMEDYIEQNYRLPYMSIEEMLVSDPVLAKLINGEVPTRPVAPVEEDVVVKDGIRYRYIYSYSARLIRSGDERQDLYNAMKNEVLSYKKVNSKISWGHELFKLGRIKVCEFKVKGKTLCVYLPLNPDNYDQEHYHFIDNRRDDKEVEFPMIMKIKSNRAVKYCSELIADVMAANNIVRLDDHIEENYRLPFMTVEQMLVSDPVLAKLVEDNSQPVDVKPVEVATPVEEDVVVKDGIRYRYIYSYSARMIRSGDERQAFYNVIKNNILSYKKVNSKISWGHELFKLGRIKIAELKVKGKTLCVYLPLDPNTHDADRLHFKETGKEEFPMMMKVKSDRACKYVAELIAEVMEANNIVKLDNYEEQDYTMPYMSVEEMLVSDPVLAKLVEDNSQPVEVKPVEVIEPAAPVEEDVVVKNGIRYRYVYSYSARMIRSGEERQEFYNVIKNNILSYKKVNSKISWGHELFKLGRIKICELKVKGKTLCVYLPLDPNTHDADRLHFKETGKEEFPMMMKVKSDRACKYVAELIAEVMEANNIIKFDDYVEQDYKMPYMSIEQMLVSDPVLAKLVEDNSAPVEVKPVEIVEPVAPVDEEIVVKNGIVYRYKFSYSARMIRSGDDRQALYNAVKNNILSYKKVNSKISWGHELFKLGRIKIAELKVKGKTLCVYLPLDPSKYDEGRLHFKETGKEEFPMMMKVKSDRAVKYVAELIEDVMANNNIVKLDNYEEQDYTMPYMSVEKMLVSDPVLAKLVEDNSSPVEVKPVEVVEPVVVPEVVEDEDAIAYRYKFSFSARLILSGEERQKFYNEIKNNILSYKKVNSKISWSHELFKLGRIKIAQMKIKGKTLCVYLPLNPANYDADRLYFKETGNEEFPMMMKVKSSRACKYVAELIADVMANNDIPHNDNYEEVDYKLKNMSIKEMLTSEPPLAKEIERADVSFEKPVEQEVVEPVVVPQVSEDEEVVVKNGVVYKYKFSFSARLIRAGMDKQDFYNDIKNDILSYKKVTSKISWGHEFFKLGRNKIAQMKVKGKTLCVYLPLNPDTHDVNRLHFKDIRKEGKEVDFPMMMKVKSTRAIKYVAELISDKCGRFLINRNWSNTLSFFTWGCTCTLSMCKESAANILSPSVLSLSCEAVNFSVSKSCSCKAKRIAETTSGFSVSPNCP